MGKITYTNKVALNENPEVAYINKVTDDDMNEIKSVVNTNDDNVGDITTLTTTTKTSTVSAINELNSTKATSNDVGNIANLTTTDKTSVVNAVNELNSNKASKNEVIISNTQPSASDNKIWIDTGEIGSAVSEITNEYSTSTGLGYSANYINNLNTYSTTEHRVGTWIDGKPLYSKYVKIPNPSEISGSGTVAQNFPHGISNLKRCVDVINPIFTGNTSSYIGRYFNLPLLAGSSGYLMLYEVDATNIVLRSRNESWSTSWDLECVLVYTKTTD